MPKCEAHIWNVRLFICQCSCLTAARTMDSHVPSSLLDRALSQAEIKEIISILQTGKRPERFKGHRNNARYHNWKHQLKKSYVVVQGRLLRNCEASRTLQFLPDSEELYLKGDQGMFMFMQKQHIHNIVVLFHVQHTNQH